MTADTFTRLLYEESVRRISGQMNVLASLRARAGTLFSAAAVATSFLGGLASRATNDGRTTLDLGLAGYLALILFVVAVVLSAAMFVPYSRLRFSIPRLSGDGVEGTEELLGRRPPPDATDADMHADVAIRLEALYAANSKTMSWLFRCMWALPLVVGAELIAWAVEFLTA